MMLKFRRFTAIAICVLALACQSSALAMSIAWISDTQNYVSRDNGIYRQMTQWIVDSAEFKDIGYVFHTGDVVSSSRNDGQWEIARDAMEVLTDAGMPFLAVTGNHDTGTPHSYTRFLDHIVSQQTLSMEQDFSETGSRYVLETIDGRDYIFLGLSFANKGPSPEETEWANNALKQHRGRTAIILTHSYIKRSGEYTTQGRAILENIVKPNPNVYMVLCGHARGVSTRIDEFDQDGDGEPDRKVYALMSNYQDGNQGGDGYMRIIVFRRQDIYIYTYSPITNSYRYYDKERDITVIPLP